MKIFDFIRKLTANKVYIFSFNELLRYFPKARPEVLKLQIFGWVKKGYIVRLKRGLYKLADVDIPDFVIAHKLYEPSYVSLETALSIYNVIPEVTPAVCSVTSKVSRKFKVGGDIFLYKNLRQKAFTGYRLTRIGDFEYFLAEPEKALVDYLYLNFVRKGVLKINFNQERFDKASIRRMSIKKISRYAGLINNKKLYQLTESLHAYAR